MARPNPAGIPYRPDDYADGPPPGRGAPGAGEADGEDGRGGSAWLWLSALLALGVLALAGFLVFKLLSSPVRLPVPAASSQVTVPNFVGMTYDQARSAATDHQLQVSAAFATSDQGLNTVLTQDPAAGAVVDPGSTITLTIAGGQNTVIVPDLTGKTESDALNLIYSTGLGIGARSEAYDPTVPVGSIISQQPMAGIVVAKGALVDYVVSQGPQPTPTPTPQPTPTPTPQPTPTPTPKPTPTPEPTAPPTPSPSPPAPSPS